MVTSDRLENVKKRKHPLAVVWGGVSWTLVLIAVLLAVALVGVRFLGYTPYAVLSPSMTPKYQVGDLVYVKACSPENIVIGDVITYVANEDLLVVTHRVVKVDKEKRAFTTKGDANDSEDLAPVLYENVVGTVEFSLPKLGYVSTYLTSQSGRYAGVAIAFALILLLLLPELFRKEQSKKKENQ